MSGEHVRCDASRVDRFFDHALQAAEQTAFEEHLQVCSTCRERLWAEAAEPEIWNEATDFLQDEPLDLDPLSCDAAVVSTESGHAPGSDVGRIIELLAPTDDPHMLGRLGGYEIAGVIGAGGMGVVLKGFDRALSRYVAIKVLAPHLASSGAARQRFAREAQAAAAVLHENVIAIHGVDHVQGLPYLVMPYVRGTSLQKRINERGPLQLIEILRIAQQTASGLAAAHAQGLVHRDIKPANILLADGVERVTITDFGLARAVDDASMTRSGIIAGTPLFMSPEQARGETIDHRSDLFSLGSLIYVMCTGRAPFRAETSYGVLNRICESAPRPIHELNPQIPHWLCRLVGRLHAKSPDQRLQSAAQVSHLLSQCLAHVQQPGREPLPQLLKRSRSNWIRAAAVVAGGVCLLAAMTAAVILPIAGGRPATRDGGVEDGDAQPRPAAAAPSDGPLSSEPAGTGPTKWDDDVAQSLLELEREVQQLEQRAAQMFEELQD